MDKYKVASDFNGTGLVPIMSSVTTAVPEFWSFMLFIIWLAVSASSYFAMLKLTGRKRFWNAFTASSFVIFIVSVVLVAMNTATITYLSGYWLAFYIMMTLIGWFLLDNYK